MVNHYVYRTINEINNMKYIGKRTCYCAIEDDMYLGSGTFIKLAIDRYGEYYFSKEILCICDTEEEAWGKEIEMINAFDAVNSREYYNVAYGGPSRQDGFIMTTEERDKMEYLTNQLENEEYYGIKILNGNTKPRIMLVETQSIDDISNRKVACYSIADDDTELQKVRKKDDGKEHIWYIDIKNDWQYLNDNGNIPRWLQIKAKFFLISKDEHKEYLYKSRKPDEFYKIVKSVKDKYGEFTNTKSIKTTKSYNTVDKDINTTCITSIDSINELAKTSEHYRNFASLLYKYDNLGLIAVYNAVTGSGSVSTSCLSDGSLKCTEEQMKKATAILDYELQFSDMVQAISGRHDYLYVVIAFCYNNKKINNDELLRRFSKKYKTFKTVKSIENAIDQIDGLYNFRMIKYPKVPLKQEYLTYKLNK